MGFFSDLFMGKRPDMQLPGYASDMSDYIKSTMPGDIGFFGRQAKQIAKQYNQDPESLATQSLNRGAVQRQQLGENYMTGANALLAHSGAGNTEQQGLQQRMKEMALDRINQNQGIAAQQEAQGKYFGALDLGEKAREATMDSENRKLGLMSSLMGLGYNNARQGGLFGGLGNALSGFAQGVGMGL